MISSGDAFAEDLFDDVGRELARGARERRLMGSLREYGEQLVVHSGGLFHWVGELQVDEYFGVTVGIWSLAHDELEEANAECEQVGRGANESVSFE